MAEPRTTATVDWWLSEMWDWRYFHAEDNERAYEAMQRETVTG